MVNIDTSRQVDLRTFPHLLVFTVDVEKRQFLKNTHDQMNNSDNV